MVKMGQKRKGSKKPIKKRFNIKVTPLDLMFSKIVKERADFTCEYCGTKTKRLNNSHFIGRRYRNTRWLLDNCSCLCFSCHNFMHDFPSVHRDFFVKRIGTEGVERLEILARSKVKVDLEEIKAKLGRLISG